MAPIAATAGSIEVRDAAGNVLADGDSVALVKDLKVKGAGQSLKQGTVIKSIRLTDNPTKSTAGMKRSRAGVANRSYAGAEQAAVSGAPQVRWQSGTQHLDCSVLPCPFAR